MMVLHSKVCQVTKVEEKLDKISLNIIVGMKLAISNEFRDLFY